LAAFNQGSSEALYDQFAPVLREAVDREQFANEVLTTHQRLGDCALGRVHDAVGSHNTEVELKCQNGSMRLQWVLEATTPGLRGFLWHE
jgi:hypothetical protein